MNRARRIFWLVMLLLLGGAVVTFAIANAIGVLGLRGVRGAEQRRYVEIAGVCVFAHDTSGAGWRDVYWGVYGMDAAPTAQFMEEEGFEDITIKAPSNWRLRLDPPDSLPGWSALWDAEHWPQINRLGTNTAGLWRVDLGLGWPLPSLAMHGDDSRPMRWCGGTFVGKPLNPGVRVLAWQPIWRGFALDTLLYAACLAGLAGGVRFIVRARRRGRGACSSCGYDLRGLAAGAKVCPECGATAGAGVRSA